MKVYKLEIENFRLLKKFSMDLEEELSLVIGKNNTGKTSILTILDKFLNEKPNFSYDDLNIDSKKKLEDYIKGSELPKEYLPLGIKLKVFIEYGEKDDLSNISKLFMDLDPDNNKVVLGFEYTLDFDNFQKLKLDYSTFSINETSKKSNNKKYTQQGFAEFLKREFGTYFSSRTISFEYDRVKEMVNENNFILLEEKGISLQNIINFKYISARRSVTNKENENSLSKQTSSLYKKYKKTEDNNEVNIAKTNFEDQISEADSKFSEIYQGMFENVIKKVRNFGGAKINDADIAIISTLRHGELIEGNTTVVYTHDKYKLPEHYNGLGHMNLINMIFEIEILVQDFKRDKDENPAEINLLFIEEPEAHTHPQMQYIFIKNIKDLLKEGIQRKDGKHRPLQYIITTHSSHIVADSDFNDIKYLKAESKNNVIAKNLKDLRAQYGTGKSQYQFLKQYLTISRAEIFFADKAVLIEGDTERILIPTFMRKVDIEEAERFNNMKRKDEYLPLLSQNISIIEVGAYSQIFEKFIHFLGIKSLIITDIDSTKEENGKPVTCSVKDGTDTGNSAIKHFLKKASWTEVKTLPIDKRTISTGGAKVCLCYQQEEDNYHARSFEDAFMHINRDFINEKKDEFKGLKNMQFHDAITTDAYTLADKCIKKKTHFALDILYHSNENFSNWNIPEYIQKGLLWLKED